MTFLSKMARFLGLDVQRDLSVDLGMNLLLADDLERNAQIMLQQATDLRRAIRPSIVLELREDGLVVISGWMGGRHDSTYRPMPLDEAIGEISSLAQELQQQPHLSSSDEHAR